MNTLKKVLYLCLALCSITVSAADSLEVRIKLKSVNDVLTFNQSFVPDNYQEYSWMVLIDTDNDPLTGNTGGGYGGNTGFDVALSISNFKLAGSIPQTGSIVSAYTQKKTIILTGNQGIVANDIVAFIDYTDTSIVMRGSTVFPELANVTTGNRYFAIATYYPPSGITVSDVTEIATIPNIITDLTNDVTYSFIDIKEVTINLESVGISESVDNSHSLNIFPNPSSGIFKIESANIKNASIKVFNILGEEVLQQQNHNEINLSSFSKGIYFVSFFDGQTVLTRKILIK